jgi:LysR family glycine cleavage system transcriptional activator
MGHMPSLIALRAFEAAARLSSFTRAALELKVSQGAISHQIRLLEAELDTALFHRTARQVVLTDTGGSLSANLTEAFAIITSAIETVQAKRDPNEVRMIFPPNLSARWLVPRLPYFRKEHPEIVLTLRHTNQLEHIEGDTDLAVTWSTTQPNDSAERLMGLFYAPVCTPQFKADFAVESVEQLADCPLLESRFCEWGDWFTRAGLPYKDVKPCLVLDNFNVLINAVLDGQGAGLCPTAYMPDYIAEGRLIRLSDVLSSSQEAFYLLSPKRSSTRLPVRKVRQWLMNQAADQPDQSHQDPPADRPASRGLAAQEGAANQRRTASRRASAS